MKILFMEFTSEGLGQRVSLKESIYGLSFQEFKVPRRYEDEVSKARPKAVGLEGPKAEFKDLGLCIYLPRSAGKW